MTMPQTLTMPQDRSGERKEAGRLTKLMMHWFFRKATVSKVEALTSNIRVISLTGDDLKAANWLAGQKIQIDVGGGVNRTYSPICWSATGETRIIAFIHGEGPGAAWASSVRAGDECQFFGPRSSMELGQIDAERPFFFGDETSLGLAQALASAVRAPQQAVHLFEMSECSDASELLSELGLPQAEIVERAPDDGHYATLDARIANIVANIRPSVYFLSGKAGSVQRVSRVLKKLGVQSKHIRARAYWAPGKRGLD